MARLKFLSFLPFTVDISKGLNNVGIEPEEKAVEQQSLHRGIRGVGNTLLRKEISSSTTTS